MLRRLVPLLFVFTVLALGAWSGSAGAIVCPLGFRSAGVPCCGPPVAGGDASQGCCPGASGCCPGACCASGDATAGAARPRPPALTPSPPSDELSIATSPNPSTDGQPVTISGRLLGGGAGTSVSLWQKLPGQSAFTRVAQTTTNGPGDYAFVRGAGTVTTNTAWYASTAGATSTTLAQRVSARVTLVKWVIAGRLVTLHGRVAPSHRGERIALQQRTARGWRTIATSVIGRLSKFTLRHHFAHKGNVLLRAVFGGDARNARAASRADKLAVR